MNDTMSKEKAADLLDNLVGMVSDTQGNDYDTALRMGADALNAERHARWQYIDYGGVGNWHCTACREITINATFYKYCPHCGARMDGGQHE